MLLALALRKPFEGMPMGRLPVLVVEPVGERIAAVDEQRADRVREVATRALKNTVGVRTSL